jgi:beta-lactamase regulating signal transducer with metallopeptidase domain/flagellar hook-basal body complex protein FliE
MNEWLGGATWWVLATAVGGGAVLSITGLAMRRAPGPVTCQRIGEWGILAALIFAVLKVMPAWWTIPDPRPQPAACGGATASALPPAEAPLPCLAPNDQSMADVPAAYAVPDPAPAPAPPAADCAPAPAVAWWDALLLGYTGIASLFAARWLAGQWALARIVNRARPAPETVQSVFDELATATGQSATRLLVSERVPVPLCCGLLHPAVLIPRSMALANDPATLRWVFAHELTHLARRDTWSAWVMGLAQVVYFYLPWFWWMKRQVRLCQEYVADAAAAAQGRWPDEYAQFLVNLARCPAAPVGATGVLGNTSDLYRRITMVLNPTPPAHRDWSRTKLVSGAACLVASAVVFAGLGVRAEEPCDDQKAADKVIIRVAPIDGENNVAVWIMDEDDKPADEKKKDLEDKKKDIRAKIVAAGDVMAAHKKELEKHLREALEKAKMSDEEIDRVVKDVAKAMEKAKFSMTVPKMDVTHPGQWPGMPGGAAFMPGAAQGGFGGTEPMRALTLYGAHVGGGRLGVTVDKPSAIVVEQLDLPKNTGLVLVTVGKGSAAEKAGLKSNDIVLRFADKDVPAEPMAFVKLIEGIGADDEVTAVVLRKGKKEVIKGIMLPEKKKLDDERIAKAFTGGRGPGGDEKSEKKSQRSVSVTVKDGEFTAKDSEGDLVITVTGGASDGKVSINSITISEGGSKKTYSSLDEVPSKYRSRVKKLTDNSGDSPVKFNFRKEEKNDNR